MAESFIPNKITCLKCNEVLNAKNIRRTFSVRGTQIKRQLFVTHHGATLEIPFAATPDLEVELWGRLDE